MKICICGGGNLGHVTAGFIAAAGNDEVRILTRRPDRWGRTLLIDTPDRGTIEGRLACVSANAAEVVPDADIVLLCLPGFSIASTLGEISPYVSASTIVGSIVSSTGFYFQARHILPAGTQLFGFQRVPFIARTSQYGHRASLLGYKKSLSMGTDNVEHPQQLRKDIERIMATPVVLLGNMYEVSLTNSNPLLHPSRLYSMWKDWTPGDVYSRNSMFYEEWTEEAAAIYIAMDNELGALLKVLPVSPGCIPGVLEYYESTDAASLAAKLRSIEAFKGILSPMKKVDGGYVPDFSSRYFTEDFPFGLAIIRNLAKEKNIPCPVIDKVYEWGMSKIS